jgi:uncharacterized protein YcbK (DUF882 family)
MLGSARILIALVVACSALAPAVARGQGHKPGKTAARAPAAAPKHPAAAAPSRGWHAPPAGRAAPVDGAGRPLLVLQALNADERVTLTPMSERGGFSAEDLDRAAHVLRDHHTGNEHPIDPRVVDLVYRVASHFSAAEVRIISGYRTPRPGSHSNHGRGRAIDLVIPGAADEEVARFAREQGFVGVGVYPTSGFVHLDVRERSYFWVDYSGPGKKNRTRGILGDLAVKSDTRALARGERAVGPFTIATDVDAALAARAGAHAPSAPPSEDDDNDDGPW